jgi:probable HAF family extracellular repeat protein
MKHNEVVLTLTISAGMMLPSAKALPPHYSILDLGTQAATSINNRKQITGESSGIAYIYFNGTFKSLGTLGGTSSIGADINQHSQVTGEADNSSNETHAFLYTGSMKDLGSGTGLSINNSGAVVGYSITSISPAFQYHAAISYHGGPLQALTNYNPDQNSVATGINESNQVVGYQGSYPHGGFIWHNGKILYLPSVDGLGGGVAPEAINKLGHVTGEAESGGYGANHWHTFLYRNGKIIIFLGKGVYTDGFAINSHDQIVGYDGPMSDGDSRAALFMNGQTFDLNNLVPADSSRLLESAASINDSGQIIAQGRKYLPNGTRENHTFLLTPLN